MSIISYKGLQIASPDPTGDAGLMINDNFVALADLLEGLQGDQHVP